jgi:hypothetical protein
MALLTIDESKAQNLESQIDSQEIKNSIQRSNDPTYPVFSIGNNINTRKLFYIPRMPIPGGTTGKVQIEEKGGKKVEVKHPEVFNIESSNVHTVMTAGPYGTNYRCTAGISGIAPGYDGTCPFDAVQRQVSEIVGNEIHSKIDNTTFDTDSEKNEKMRKTAIKDLYANFGVVETPKKEFVIPVFVFDLEGNAGVKIAKDKSTGKNIQPKLQWYIVKEFTWNHGGWADSLTNHDIQNPAGQYFIVNIPDNPNNPGDTRYAGQNLRAELFVPEETSSFAKNRGALDKVACNPDHPWTRDAARATLPEFGFFEMDEIKSIAETASMRLKSLTNAYAGSQALGMGTDVNQLPSGITDTDSAPATAPTGIQGAPSTDTASDDSSDEDTLF